MEGLGLWGDSSTELDFGELGQTAHCAAVGSENVCHSNFDYSERLQCTTELLHSATVRIDFTIFRFKNLQPRCLRVDNYLLQVFYPCGARLGHLK